MRKILIILSILACVNILIITVNKAFAATVNMPSAPSYGTSSVSNDNPSASYKQNTKPNYSNEDKKEFYDGFSSEFFNSMGEELISEGFQKSGVQIYTNQLKGRFNRAELENATWSCVSKYSVEQLIQNTEKITTECFGGWITKFIGDNADLAQKYLKK